MGLHVSYIHRLFPVGWTLWKLRPAESNHFTCGFRLSEYVSDCTGMADTAFGNGEGQHKLKIWTEQKGHFKLCNKCHKLTLSVLLHKTPTAVFKQSWRTLLVKGCCVFQFWGSDGYELNLSPPSHDKCSDSTCWTHSDSGSIPSEAHAPLSFRSGTGWARQHFAQGLSMLPILLGGNQLFIESTVSSPVSVSSLQTIALQEIFWQCHALQVVILSGVSLGRVQISCGLFGESSTPFRKKKKPTPKKGKHVRLNSTACELITTCHSNLHYEYL